MALAQRVDTCARTRCYGLVVYSYGLYSYGLFQVMPVVLYSYDLCSYGPVQVMPMVLDSYDLYRFGLNSYGPGDANGVHRRATHVRHELAPRGL